MKKYIPITIIIILIVIGGLVFLFTRHTHTFSEATCDTASICECGEIQGEALGHTWIDANCETAKTCSVCGATEGTPLDHTWLDATYDAPQTCEICGTTQGEPLVAPEEPTVNTGVDSVGSDAVFTEEDEYIEEPAANTNTETTEPEQPKDDLNSQIDALEEKYRQKYENGEIDEEFYQSMIDAFEKEREAQNQPQQPSNPPITVEVPGVSEDTGDGGDRGGDLSDVELPPELWGDFIN